MDYKAKLDNTLRALYSVGYTKDQLMIVSGVKMLDLLNDGLNSSDSTYHGVKIKLLDHGSFGVIASMD